MGRYLIFFSYIGTKYSGVQQQFNALHKGHAVKTTGGLLEDALQSLKPANPLRIQASSRTDKGVHALRNSCHVDLIHPNKGMEFDPAVITSIANYNLSKNSEDIRVLETKRVSDDFHCRRYALGRKYIYRLAFVTKPGISLLQSDGDQSLDGLVMKLKRYTMRSRHPRPPIGNITPCLDLDKIGILRSKHDISKLLQAASLLSGVHDFTAFSTKHSKEDHKQRINPVKMLTIGVKRGQPFGQGLLRYGLDPSLAEHLEFWDIHVRAHSFLYKMVRRCVGGMLLVARDVISLADLKDILDNPRRDFQFTSSMSFVEKGLFLADVEYNDKDLLYPKSDIVSGKTLPDDGDSETEILSEDLVDRPFQIQEYHCESLNLQRNEKKFINDNKRQGNPEVL